MILLMHLGLLKDKAKQETMRVAGGHIFEPLKQQFFILGLGQPEIL